MEMMYGELLDYEIVEDSYAFDVSDDIDAVDFSSNAAKSLGTFIGLYSIYICSQQIDGFFRASANSELIDYAYRDCASDKYELRKIFQDALKEGDENSLSQLAMIFSRNEA